MRGVAAEERRVECVRRRSRKAKEEGSPFDDCERCLVLQDGEDVKSRVHDHALASDCKVLL